MARMPWVLVPIPAPWQPQIPPPKPDLHVPVMLAGMRWPTSASYAADDSLYGWRSEAHHRDTDQGAILAACTPGPTIL